MRRDLERMIFSNANLILYTHINCKDARDLDILIFLFVFGELFGGFLGFGFFSMFLVFGFFGLGGF